MKKIYSLILILISIIFCDSILAYNEYSIGDIIKYQGEDFYVIDNSDEDQSYVTALKKDKLTKEEVNKYSSEYESQNGEYPYLISNTCIEVYSPDFHRDYSGCTNNYDESNIKEKVDDWAEKYNDILVKIDGYKARLISEDDLTNLGYKVYFYTGHLRINDDSGNFYNWIFDDYEYWGMNSFESMDDMKETIVVSKYNSAITDYVYTTSYIRPVVNFDKCKAFNDCNVEEEIKNNDNKIEKIKGYKQYTFGDKVTYNGEDYYVLIDSEVNKKYVTLLKANPLTKEEIAKYYQGEIKSSNGYGTIKYGGSNVYDNSNVKKIVDAWSNDKFGNKLHEEKGYKARIPSLDDLIDYLFFEPIQYGVSAFSYKSGSDTPCWAISNVDSYFTMSGYEDSNNVWTVVNDDIQSCGSHVFYKEDEYSTIRPIVNVDKCLLDSDSAACSNCTTEIQKKTIKNYLSYKASDKITYKGDKYIVARDSDDLMSYVTLIKAKPFTYEELNKYGVDENGNSVINRFPYINQNETLNNNEYGEIDINDPNDIYDNSDATLYYYVVEPGKALRYSNGIGGMQFYSSSECGYVNGKFINKGCNRNYSNSNIKIVIDNWVKDKEINEDLVNINEKGSRLINMEEQKIINNFLSSSEIYYWFLNDNFYENDDSSYDKVKVFTNVEIDGTFYYSNGFNYYFVPNESRKIYSVMGAVFPVINVSKSAISDSEIGEYEVEVCKDDLSKGEINDESKEKPKTSSEKKSVEVIEMENTLKQISFVVITIGILLIFIGYIIYKKINKAK